MMSVTNLVALQFAMGYQGGTIHQMAEYLKTTTEDILNADEDRMGILLRKAQQINVHFLDRKSLRNALENACSYLSKAVAEGLLDDCVIPLSSALPKLNRVLEGQDQ